MSLNKTNIARQRIKESHSKAQGAYKLKRKSNSKLKYIIKSMLKAMGVNTKKYRPIIIPHMVIEEFTGSWFFIKMMRALALIIVSILAALMLYVSIFFILLLA